MIYGVILNDQSSVKKIGDALAEAPYKGAPKAPAMYLKPANTVVGDGATVRLPEGASAVEIGATLGLVIGRSAARLTRDGALGAIGGVVVVADLSLPHTSYYRPAIREKCFDGACPVSPSVPLSTLGDWKAVVITTEIDGAMVERRSLADLIRDPVQLLVDVSEFMTLQTGDVLLLGVGYQAPQARAGSRVRVSVQGMASVDFSLAEQGVQP